MQINNHDVLEKECIHTANKRRKDFFFGQEKVKHDDDAMTMYKKVKNWSVYCIVYLCIYSNIVH